MPNPMPNVFLNRNFGRAFIGLIFTVTVLFILSLSAQAQPHISAKVVEGAQAQPRDILTHVAVSTSILQKGRTGNIQFRDAVAMQDFYAARQNREFWNDRNAKEMLDLIKESWTHGLHPEEYHYSLIQKKLQGGLFINQSDLDLLLTDAAIRFGQDVSGMRIDPEQIKQSYEYWQHSYPAATILDMMAASSDPVAQLQLMSPQHKLYKSLQAELVRLAQESALYDHVLPMSFGGDHHFEPGEISRDVPNLRIRLGVDYDERQGSPNFYDDRTAAAVMQFQRDHNLEPDGIIGPQTLSVLNRTNRARMEQVVANLERQRWLPRELPAKYLLVNIPQQLLWAVENGRVLHEVKVVVGMPWRRTKDFKTEVTGIRINPRWTAPLSIKMQDILPKVRQDINYLSEKGIEVIQGYGSQAVTLDPHSIDWHNITRARMSELRLVQTPGDHNALGRIRILMPNKYNIYFHDTNHPEYFERGQRTYSSGCIRMAEPENIADFVMKGSEGWERSQIDEIKQTMEETDIKIKNTFPAYMVYHSIWMDSSGKLVFGPDVYKRDAELLDVLNSGNSYYFPPAESLKFGGKTIKSQGLALAD